MLKRHIEKELQSFLRLMPVVLLTGARQTGKTTLVESITQEHSYYFITLDDDIALAAALGDPSGWLSSLPKPVIIDEVQRAPEIFLSIKRDVDQNRIPGRYLLTGSANPLLLPRLGDSLAGRLGVLTLFPFSQGEIREVPESFISKIFGDELLFENFAPLAPAELYRILLRGGFPLVQSLDNVENVQRWLNAYLQTMMQRDVRDISNIEGLKDFPKLFRLLATRSGSLLNIADLSRTLGMVNMTLHRYLSILEALYFIHLLPAWFSNLGKRLIKSPKLHLSDTALMAALIDIDETRLQKDSTLTGQFLENLVFSELLKQKSWSAIPFELNHFRDGDYEVDFILERPDGTIIAIEVKSAKSLHSDDLRGLKHLQRIAKDRLKRGIILHSGTQTESLGENLYALPLQSLWS